jgi:hypothetical protein
MKQPVVILIAGSVVAVSFIGWRLHAMRHHTLSRFELVYDPSLSFTGGCESLVGAAEKVLRNPGVSDHSTLTILALGEASTAYEPRRLTKYAIPTDRKVIEGRHASMERQEHLLEDLRARCRSVRPTSVTPIYLGVKQAIGDLRADGCTADSRCGLWVSTDLEENGDRAIEATIDGRHDGRKPLPLPLDNSGISVTFCGFVETAGRLVGPSGREIRKAVPRDPRRDERLQAVWRSLFASSELVSFEPYCPQPTILPAQEAAEAQRGQR